MATTMQRLLHKPLQQTLFSHLKLQNPLNLLPSLLQHPPRLGALPEDHNPKNFNTEETQSTKIPISSLQENKAAMDNRLHLFPSFSVGLLLSPSFSPGLHQIETVKSEKSDLDESQIMWADSVKKKRKKKMNKHKLRKLRKRIRGYA